MMDRNEIPMTSQGERLLEWRLGGRYTEAKEDSYLCQYSGL